MDPEDESNLLVEDKDKERYRHAQNGDHLMEVPFECDLCHFRNMNGRDPVWRDLKDLDTLEAIRRAQLDVFWAREEATVRGNLSRLRRDYLDVTGQYNVGDSLLPYFPGYTLKDRVGMGAAVAMLSVSLRPGKYCQNIGFGTTP